MNGGNIMVSYHNKAIKEIGDVVTGKTPPTANEDYYDGEYMFISPTELHGDYAITKSAKTITKSGLNSIRSNSIKGTSVLVGCIGWDMGNVGMCFEECATNQQINSITNIKEICNPYYLYYWLCGKKEYLFSIASVTRTPILSKGTFEGVEIPLPTRKYQDSVAQVLNAIDRKISLNKNINDNLQQQLALIYEHMMSQAMKNEIHGHFTTVSKLSEVVTGKEDANFSTFNGKFKFFTCSNDTLNCNEYIWDASAILIAGNGDFNVKHYTGKFNAYQRTYVLIPYIDYYGLLYMASLHQINSFKSASAGSIVKFITKGDIENIPVFIPDDSNYLEQMNQLVLFQENNNHENEELNAIRNWLLPMLINGQVTVTD